MLLLLRTITIILAIILVISLIISLSLLIRSSLEKRFRPDKQKKKKQADLPSDVGVRALIAEGKIDDAIDLYQRFTGSDEFTARMTVEDMAREIRLGQFDQDLHFIMNDHGKAAAIQAYQAGTGCDFDEALAYIEQLEKAKL